MLSVQVNIGGDDATIDKLRSLQGKLQDFSNAMSEIGDELISYYQGQAFDSQGGVYGSVWQTLSKPTEKYKIKLFPQYATQPLVASGAMRQSFTKQSSSDSVYVTNSASYFPYHQSDEDRTSKLPRRQMIGVNDDVRSIVQQVIQADIEEKLGSL